MLIAVTSRALCTGDFCQRVAEIAATRPERIILREKDLSEEAYQLLAERCQQITQSFGICLTINHFTEVAKRLGIGSVQVSYAYFCAHQEMLAAFTEVGVSVHAVSEAVALNGTCADYLLAGHIFPTASKKDLPPRGLTFLKEVCAASELPVYAIGGITDKHLPSVLEVGAIGVCLMSQLMTCPDVQKVAAAFGG